MSYWVVVNDDMYPEQTQFRTIKEARMHRRDLVENFDLIPYRIKIMDSTKFKQYLKTGKWKS